IEAIGQILHLRITAFAREPFEFAGGFTGLVDHLLLLAPASASALIAGLLHALLLLFDLSLHPARQLFQLALRLVVLLLRLLLALAVERLVLVLPLVHLELEEVGEFFGLLIVLPLARLVERDLDFAEDRVGALQLLQRALFGGHGVFALARLQLLDR